jgi:hypothetical protein
MASEEGQATLEAAMLLPTLMLMLAMLVQPACILYTRCVMLSAAAEGCRLMATADPDAGQAEQSCLDYVRRRLGAVPDVPIFHVGGQDGWSIELGGGVSEHEASARIVGTVTPLPLLGVIPALLGETDGEGNVVVEVGVTQTTRPSWLDGGYDDWTADW